MTAFKATSTVTAGSPAAAFNSDSAGADSVTLDAGSFLIATNTFGQGAFLRNTGAWTATLNGSVTSLQDFGLWLQSANAASSSITVGKEGSIAGKLGALLLESSVKLTNLGTITSFDDGVASALIDLRTSGVVTIGNSGSMRNPDGAAIVDNGNASKLTITNSGEIDGSIQMNSGTHSITNAVKGSIFGDISSLAGVDTLSNAGGIFGNISLGSGANNITNSGRVFGNIVGGADGDIVTNSGTINGDVNLGNGVNSLTNSKSITGDVLGGSGVDTVTNTGVIGGTVTLGAGNDIFKGGASTVTVVDGLGSDKVTFGKGGGVFMAVASGSNDGVDTITGGSTNSDFYSLEGGSATTITNLDKVQHGANDFPTIVGVTAAANTATSSEVGIDKLIGIDGVQGSGGADLIFGNAGNNVLSGGDGSDFLFGLSGTDSLFGGSGQDLLVGGAGADSLLGNSGTSGDGVEDRFVYLSASDSGVTGATRDSIFGFEDGFDKIDLSRIDANTKNGAAINDAFTYINVDSDLNPGATFQSNVAGGQLRSYLVSNGHIVEGDTNGDGKADFSILIFDPDHAIQLTSGDFIL
jgi:hypothetical protein